jgi:hypothetical protein
MLKNNKLIQLMRTWPEGAVLTSEWLIHKKGYSKGLLQQYHRSGWIELLGKGAYRRAQVNMQGAALPLTWAGGVYALQALSLNWNKEIPPVHVAARAALELSGFAHFLKLSGKETLWLFAEPGYRVPTWFRNYKWNAKTEIYSPKLFSKALPETFSKKDWGAFATLHSCPERAMMELLELCPKYESLDHAKLVMESLATLRPKVVTELLQNCTSVKVKRLFLALADVCNHAWLAEINTSKLELGSGKRVLEPDRSFHVKYQISVPREEACRLILT